MITAIYNIAANTAFLEVIDLNRSLQPNSIGVDLIYFKRWTSAVECDIDILDAGNGIVQVETGVLKPAVYIFSIYDLNTLIEYYSAIINVSDESIVYGYQGVTGAQGVQGSPGTVINVSSGTATPSGGASGDVYFQYE